MYRLLLLLFLTVPMAEMAILIWVGGVIGALPTILAVAVTAVVGVWLLRLQGFLTLRRVQERLQKGELPDTELLEGALLLIGGTLLLTPGFMTDILGFIFLFPGSRRGICRRILENGLLKPYPIEGANGGESFYYESSETRFHQDEGEQSHPHSHQTIDGEYHRDDK
jgi:UPF0716 protein FxsA